MERIQGLSIGLDLDTIKVDSGLKDLRSKLTLVNSEMRSNMSAFDRSDKSIGKYQKSLEGLNKKLTVQKEITDRAHKNYEKMVAAHGEGSKEAEKAATAYNREAAELNNLERYIERTTNELREMQEQQRYAESNWGKLGRSMESLGSKMTNVGNKMKGIGKSMSMYITAPLVGFGVMATKTGIDFDDSMAKVQAISGATGEDLLRLRDKAKQMGSDTKFSASQSADALNYMAMAGWKTEDMLSGIDGVMALAASSGEDLAVVSDIVTDALTAFGMSAKDSARFADVLAAASANSNTNVAMLGNSFEYAAPVAGALGYKAEDVSVALGLMANAGIKADKSGTALRTMMTNLAKPSKEMKKAMDQLGLSLTDANGEMKSWDEVMGDMRKSFSGMKEDQQAATAATIFGKEAMSGALAVINASEDDYNKLSEAINNSEGAAESMAEIMEGKLGGTIRRIKSGLEGFAISIYESMLPALEKGAAKFEGFVNWINKLSPAVKTTGVFIGALVAAIGPVLLAFGTFIVIVGNAIKILAPFTRKIHQAGGLLGYLRKAMMALSGPVGLIIAGITAAIAVGVAWYKNFEKLEGILGSTTTKIIGMISPITAIPTAMKLLKRGAEDTIPAVDRFGDSISEKTKQALGSFFDLSDGASKSMANMTIKSTKITTKLKDSLVNQFKEMNAKIIEGMEKSHAKQLDSTKKFFSKSSALTEAEEEKIIANQTKRHKKEIKDQKAKEDAIEKIMSKAAAEKRELTKLEAAQIAKINEEMQVQAVKVLSKNEMEQKVILERMKATATDLSAKQAADVVKNAVKQRDKVVKEAEKQYDQSMAEIIRLRDETGDITKEQADKMIKEAERTKEKTVSNAKDMHKEVIKEAKLQSGEHVNNVDWTTGEILTKWEFLKRETVSKFKEMTKETTAKIKEMKDQVVEKFEEIREKVKGIASGIKGLFKDDGQEGRDILLGMGFSEKTVMRMDKVAESLALFRHKVIDTIEGVKGLFKDDGEKGRNILLGLGFSENTVSNLDRIAESISTFRSNIIDAVDGVKGIFKGDGGKGRGLLEGIGFSEETISSLETAANTISTFKDKVKGTLDGIKGLFKDDGGKGRDILTGIGFSPDTVAKMDKVAEVISDFRWKVSETIKSVKNLLKGDGTKTDILLSMGIAPDTVVKAKEIFEGIKKGLQDAFKAASDFAKGLKDTVVKFFKEEGPGIKESAKNIFGEVIKVVKQVGQIFKVIFDGIVKVVEFALPLIWKIIKGAFELIVGLIKFAMPLILYIIKTVWGNIKGVITGVLDVLQGAVKIFSGLFTGDFAKMWEGIKQLFWGAIVAVWNFFNLLFVGRILKGVVGFAKLFGSALSGMWTFVKGLFTNSVGAVFNTAKSGFTLVLNTIKTIVTTIRNVITSIWNAILIIIRTVTTSILNVTRNIFNSIKNTINTIITGIFNIIKRIWNAIFNTIRTVVNNILSTVRNIFNSIKNTVSSIIQGLFNIIRNIWNSIFNTIKSVVTNIWKTVTGIFTTMKNGVVNLTSNARSGIVNQWNRIKSSVTNLAKDMWTAVKNKFDDMVEGAKALPGKIGEGIKNAASKASDAVKNMGNKMIGSLEKPVNSMIGGVNWVTGKLGIKKEIGKLTIPQFAKGTTGDGHKGGLAIVGEEGRELIKLPNGKSFVSPGTDTMLDLPKGTHVIPNKPTEEILKFDLPHYSKGTKGWFGKIGEVWDYVKNPSKIMNKVLDGLGIGKVTGFAKDLAGAGWEFLKTKPVEYIKNIFNQAEEEGLAPGSGKPAFTWPVTSGFGYRTHPIFKTQDLHAGTDFGAPSGSLIPSTTGGKITWAGRMGGFGNLVRVKNGIMEMYYAHMSKILVGLGQSVKKGDILGLVGSTGDSTGPHLHYETRKNGQPINPMSIKGFADGGLIKREQLAMVGEGNYEEVIIPTGDPRKRTNAMKLIALAAKKLGVGGGGSNGSVGPGDLPNLSLGNDGPMQKLLAAVLEQNEILMQMLQKDNTAVVEFEPLYQSVKKRSAEDEYGRNQQLNRGRRR